MSTIAHLHLAQTESALPGDRYRFQRRGLLRRPASGRVTALLAGRASRGTVKRMCRLFLRDRSEGGVGAVAPEPIEAGTPLVVLLPDRGGVGGEVVRCERETEGYRIGIKLNPTEPTPAV